MSIHTIYNSNNDICFIFDNLHSSLVQLKHLNKDHFLLSSFYLNNGVLLETYKYTFDKINDSYLMNIHKKTKKEPIKEIKKEIKKESKNVINDTRNKQKTKNNEDDYLDNLIKNNCFNDEILEVKENKDSFKSQTNEEKIKQEKRNSLLSIFSSDKSTYAIFKSKVDKEVLKEKNISPFFMSKYYIIKFMDKNMFINLNNNEDIEIELDIYLQLEKVIEEVEHENKMIMTTCECQTDCNCKQQIVSSNNNPINSVDEDYKDLCYEFIKYLEELNEPVYSSKSYHKMLDTNVKLRNELFKDTLSHEIQSIFS